MSRPTSIGPFAYLAARPRLSVSTVTAIVLCTAIAGLWLYTMYSTLFGQAETFTHASTFYLVSLFLVFVLKPTGRPAWNSPINAWFLVDLLAIAATIGVFVYIRWDVDALVMRGTGAFANTEDRIAGALLILVTLEATRRTVGLSLAVLAALFFAYATLSNYVPPPLQAKAIPVGRMIDTTFFDTSGIFGLPVAISSTYIVIFLIFGALLFNTGIGQLFSDLAFIFTGRARGGPAKAAVVGSTLFGMVTGSASANVGVVGTITIPLMMKAGYRPAVAAGIEATSSVGSLIAPPVMGAGAFVMAAYMGVSYWDVALMALVPALLYYFYVFMCVHFEAVRFDIKRWDAPLPALKEVLKQRGHLLVPLALLIVLLVRGTSAAQSAMWASLTTIGVSYFRKETALTPWQILTAMEGGIRNGLTLFAACGAAGIIICAVSTTGLGTRFTELLVYLSGNELWIAAVLSAFIGLVLGLGLTPTVVYLTMYALVIPALVRLGASEPGSHMMAFYYGLLGELTPPVAVSAFTAAAIAGANPMTASWHAMRMGLAVYLLPIMFVYSPEVMLIGKAPETVIVIARAFAAVFLLAVTSGGAFYTALGWFQRLVFAVAGICLLLPPSWWSTLVAAALVLPIIIAQRRRTYGPRSAQDTGNANVPLS
jgi:TRAP transporter 4TM/12TM fusion protein